MIDNQSTSYVSTLFRNFRWTTMKNWIYYSAKFVKVLTLFKWINNQFFVSVFPCILILIWRTFCFKVPYTWKFSDVKCGAILEANIVHIFYYNFLIKFQTIYKILFHTTRPIDYFDEIYSKEDWNIFLYNQYSPYNIRNAHKIFIVKFHKILNLIISTKFWTIKLDLL